MGSALIAGIVALVGAAIGYYTSEKTNEASADRQRENQEWQEQMMDKQNEYNSPSAQMQRLSDAGVNPSTAFMGSSSVVGNTSAGVNSSPLLPVVDPAISMGNLMTSMSGGYRSIEEALDINTTRQARLVQILEQNENLRQNSKLVGAQANEQLIINNYADARENLARAGQRSQIHLNYRQSALFKANERRFRFEVDKILPEELKLKVQQGKLNILDMDKVIAEIADLRASAALKGVQSQKTGAEIEDLQMDVALKGAQRDLTEQESLYYADLQNKYLEYYDSMINKFSAEANLTDEQAYWYCIQLQSNVLDNSPYNFGLRRKLQDKVIKYAPDRPNMVRSAQRNAQRNRAYE